MKRLLSAAVCLAGVFAAGIFGAQSLKDIKVRQGYPKDNLIDIGYTVEGARNTDGLGLRVKATDPGTGKSYEAKSFTGAVPLKNGSHHIVWDFKKDKAAIGPKGMTYEVSLVKLPLYVVVDMSSGPSSKHYPVTALDALPAGKFPNEYRMTKMAFRRIPAGSFMMGSPVGELGRNNDETQHKVTLTKDFYLGVIEVTQNHWGLMFGNNISYIKKATHPAEHVTYEMVRGNSLGSHWPQSSAVDNWSFMGGMRFRTGMQSIDLPTEAQWEYACRAGTTTSLNSGKNITTIKYDGLCPNLKEVGMFFAVDGGSTGHAEPGLFKPNAWGLYDMHGNMYEYCLDWYNEKYEGSGTDPVGPKSGTYRVMRGGSWCDSVQDCRSAARNCYHPSYEDHMVGFRAMFSSSDVPADICRRICTLKVSSAARD